MWEAQNFSKSLASDLMISFRAHFTTWDEIDKDSWFLIEPHEGHPDAPIFYCECPKCGEPLVDKDDHQLFGSDHCLNCDNFDTLDAVHTVYYGDKGAK